MIRVFIFLITLFTITFGQENKAHKYGMASEPKGLKVGTKAPAFKGIDQNGNVHSLQSLTKDGPLVIIFYRGQWCPVCNRYLKSFQDSLNIITSAGAKVLAVTPERLVNVNKTIFKTGLKIPVLADTTRSIIQAYGVEFDVTDEYNQKIKNNLSADIAKNNAQEQATLPVPATYIIDHNGVITWRQFDYNYKKRASVKHIAENLPKDN